MIVGLSYHPWEFRVSHVVAISAMHLKTAASSLEDVNHVTCDSVVFNAAMSACERGTTWQATKSARAKWKTTGVMAWQYDFTNLDTLPKNDVARANTDTQDGKGWRSFVARTPWSNRVTWHTWSCSRYLLMFHTEGQTAHRCPWPCLRGWVRRLFQRQDRHCPQKDMTRCRVVHLYIDQSAIVIVNTSADSFLQFAWDLCW